MMASGAWPFYTCVRNDWINRITIVGTGVLALVVFGGLCIRHNVPAIEAELAARATATLKQQRLGWAKIEMDGRDLLLSGVAPDDVARARAMRAASVEGVRLVEDRMTTMNELVSSERTAAGVADRPERPVAAGGSATAASEEPFRTRLIIDDGRLVLEGDAPGENARRRLVTRAQQAFGIAAVEARLSLRDPAPPDWEQALTAALDVADRLVLGEIVIETGAVSVSGLTATDEGDVILRNTLESSLPDGYRAQVETGSRRELDAMLRTSPDLARRLAERDRQRTASSAVGAVSSGDMLDSAECERAFRQQLADARILFDTASATLTKDSRDLLDGLALVLKRCPSARVAIEGHTDDQGLQENNLALSQRRAEEVMLYLVSKGIGLGRLSARGFGEESPLVANETAADRARNRRIEFVFEN